MFCDWQFVEKHDVFTVLSEVKIFFNKNIWIDYPYSIDQYGIEVDPADIRANKWSLLGLIEKFSKKNFDINKSIFVSCAVKDFLSINFEPNLITKIHSYDYEYELVCYAVEYLSLI